MVKSVNYEEVLFNEPVEQFYEILTGGTVPFKGKSGKTGKPKSQGIPTAEIPERISPANVYSREEESKELDRLGNAIKVVEKMIAQERSKMEEEEKKLEELRKTEHVLPTKKK